MKLESPRQNTCSALNLLGQNSPFNILLTNLNQWSDSVPVYCILMIPVALRSDTKCPKKQIHCIVKPQLESQAELRVKMETPKSNLIVPALQPQMVVLPSPGIPLKLPVTPEKKKTSTQKSPAKTGTLSGKQLEVRMVYFELPLSKSSCVSLDVDHHLEEDKFPHD